MQVPIDGAATVHLVQLTDLHLFEDASRELYGVNTSASFRAALAAALAESPFPLDAILVTGDIADDGQAGTYRLFRAAVAGLGVPVLCLPGNHEQPAVMSDVLDAPPLRCGGSHDIAGWRIVMLDSHVQGEDSGWLDEAELERLDRALAGAGHRHALVCLHHQPVPVGSPWLDGVGLRNALSLMSVLGRHANVRGLVFGHVHQAFDRIEHGIRMLGTPSTCAQFTPHTQQCLMDLRPPGFRRLQLMPTGAIDTTVAWVESLQRRDRPPDSRRQAAV